MKYTVVLQPRAHRQFRHIVRWPTARSPEGAERWITAFESAVTRLEQDPESCGLASETIRSFRELRQTFFKQSVANRIESSLWSWMQRFVCWPFVRQDNDR